MRVDRTYLSTYVPSGNGPLFPNSRKIRVNSHLTNVSLPGGKRARMEGTGGITDECSAAEGGRVGGKELRAHLHPAQQGFRACAAHIIRCTE